MYEKKGNVRRHKKPYPFVLGYITIYSGGFYIHFIYKFDNKYTRAEPQALNGVLLLDNLTLERYPVLYLVNGWEYYGGRLLTPKAFERSAEKPLPTNTSS